MTRRTLSHPAMRASHFVNIMLCNLNEKRNMDLAIQDLLDEVEVYRSHGLYADAVGKCEETAELIRKSDHLQDKEALVTAVLKKMMDLQEEARKFEEVEAEAPMSTKELEIIKKLFSFSIEAGADSAALEGAIAFLVFGQYEKALEEFSELIKRDALRVFAAKNMLRCYIGLSSLDGAISQYEQWLPSGEFTPGQLEKIRAFLQNLLDERGIDRTLPIPARALEDVRKQAVHEEAFIDILYIVIPVDRAAGEERGVRVDVTFQRGDTITVILSNRHSSLIDQLEVGSTIDNIEFFSLAVTFTDSCNVYDKRRIRSGPKRGDYAIVMKVLNA